MRNKRKDLVEIKVEEEAIIEIIEAMVANLALHITRKVAEEATVDHLVEISTLLLKDHIITIEDKVKETIEDLEIRNTYQRVNYQQPIQIKLKLRTLRTIKWLRMLSKTSMPMMNP